MKREKLEQMLLQVQKPAQYIGGELNSVMKDKTRVDCRLAFCFPDKYEVGMSHLGMKILYSLYNQRENWWCERVFAPDADMEALLRKEGEPLYALESLDPIKDFDFILFTLQYEMSYTGVLNMLDLAGGAGAGKGAHRPVADCGRGRPLRLQPGAAGRLCRPVYPR